MKTVNVINLTQHTLTAPQLEGFKECGIEFRTEVLDLITFTGLPTREVLANHASRLAGIAKDAHAVYAIVGGAPYFMGPLELALRKVGITPIYAFTERVVVETTNPETGEVTKTSKFNFAGWIEGAC